MHIYLFSAHFTQIIAAFFSILLFNYCLDDHKRIIYHSIELLGSVIKEKSTEIRIHKHVNSELYQFSTMDTGAFYKCFLSYWYIYHVTNYLNCHDKILSIENMNPRYESKRLISTVNLKNAIQTFDFLLPP